MRSKVLQLQRSNFEGGKVKNGLTSYPSSSAGAPARTSIHWPSAGQLILSLLAAFFSLSSAVGLAGVGFGQLFRPAGPTQQDLTIFVAAAGAFLTGVLVLPSAWYALLRLIDKPVVSPAWATRLSDQPLPLILALIVLLVTLFAGNFVANDLRIAWLLLPPLQLLAVGLPVYIFSTLGRWKLSAGSPQRNWGIFSAGLVLGPAIILVLEVLAGIGFVLLGILYISLRPDLQQELILLAGRINAAGRSPEAMLKILEPYLFNPLVIATLFAFISVVVPLIEEAFKPIGAWFVAGSHLTAAQGFAAGLLSGTGYALFENLALSNAGSDWAVTLIGRIGTGLLHITTAGLTGWALITAVNERRYLRLAFVYLVSVVIHGLWNVLALVSALATLDLSGAGSLGSSFNTLARVSQWATIGLGIMVLVIFIVLLVMNQLVRRRLSKAPEAVN
jgi:hypothetical protein